MIQDGSYIQRFPCYVEYSHPQSEESRRHFACDFNSRGAPHRSLRAVTVNCGSNQNNQLSGLAPYIQFRLQIMDDDQEYIHGELHVNGQLFFAEYQVNFSSLAGICTNPAPSTAIQNLCWQEASIIDSSEIPLFLLHALQHSDTINDVSNLICLEWYCDAAIRGVNTTSKGGHIRLFIGFHDQKDMALWKDIQLFWLYEA
ncbi:hypothetical protein GJ744_006826 [Endocarpon pusillum]|uniref:Uncharacterized protein n=1 Tax=Endocarpon pusillum TaxID=364733 RepID=A0A8H7AJN6_9EURO|nr:hypothetical protein GJ744_006826 [Endocarpon pusillum]